MLVVLVVLLRALTAASTPYPARLIVDAAYVHLAPDARAAIVGLLRLGDEVTITGCVPACDLPGAWALLDGGAIRASLLRPRRDDDEPLPGAFDYGRVRAGGARVRSQPSEGAPVVERRRAGQDLAFVPDAVLRSSGWLRRIYGGFVRADEITPSTASTFAGERDPTLPLAFVVADTGAHHRYDRAPVLSFDRRQVVLADGALPRNRMRIARARRRPATIPDGARWVHVSLGDEVLVAYEGDRAVFATLVSTGIAEHPTPAGLFRVYHKEIHASMHGDPPEPYYVDEVPFVQYFSKGISLHGTFWHDRFGREASHGCINLSMADARFLFDWAPPKLPAGWHAVEPEPAGLPSLWVLITR